MFGSLGMREEEREFTSVSSAGQNSLTNVKEKFLKLKAMDKSIEEVSKNDNHKSSQDDNVEVFFTEDPSLLNQYYVLRQICFDEVDRKYRERHPENCGDWMEYDGSENQDDRAGKILVVTDGNGKVVGGMRFLVSDWVAHTMNEDPTSGFTIRKFLKTYNLNADARYCECDDIIVDSSFRSIGLPQKIFSTAIEEAFKQGCQYIIGISVKVSARSYRIVLKSLGYDCDIMYDYTWIKQRDHGYEDRYPLVVYLNGK